MATPTCATRAYDRAHHSPLLDELITTCSEMIKLAEVVRGFAGLLRPREDNADRLEAWIATARAAGCGARSAGR
ncbi:hypothetical protein [Nonomuraea sp. NPDC050786]|uniref:hypothetical protein n=1 Tax=Nonomuraea sp. NPDC050786 TaxID=3154840 RepID=UPI0033C71081